MRHYNRIYVFFILGFLLLQACNKPSSTASAQASSSEATTTKKEPIQKSEEQEFVITDNIVLKSISKSDDEWKSELSDIEYYVIREKGTERAFTGSYWDNKSKGIYVCNACDMPLYDSETKFKSGTGWPSYYEAIKKEYILEDTDYNLGYARTEIMCARCQGHLGHVFNDGPAPTGKRHCVNSVSLKFIPDSETSDFYNSLSGN